MTITSANKDQKMDSLIYIFTNHNRLQDYLTDHYIDLSNGIVDDKGLLEVSRPWSRSEKFMLNFALHLFYGDEDINLNEVDCLDSQNKNIVFEALCIRFNKIIKKV